MHSRFVFAALLLGSVNAAETEAPIVLPPWLVEETILRPDASAPRASVLLTPEVWSGRAVATLADALGRVPGVIMLESFGGFEPPRLSLRGSGLQSAPSSRGVALLLDGLPLGLADGSFNSALFDPRLGSAIAVQRGPDAWRAAPAALGGAFDLLSARDPASMTTLRTEAGSFGALRASASGAVINSATAFGGAVSFARQDGWRAQSGQERIAFDASVRRALAGHTEASVNFYYARPRYDVPGPLTLAIAQADPRSVSAEVWRDRPSRDAELWRLATTVATFESDREFEAGASLARTNDRFQQLQANGISLSRSHDAALHAAFAQRFTAAGLRQQARLIANAARGWRDLRRYRNDSGATGLLFGRDGLYATTASLALEDNIALTHSLTATLAVARIAARRDIVDRFTPARTTQRLGFGATVPQASLRWIPTSGIAVFGGVARAVEPPTFDDLLVVSGAYPDLTRDNQTLCEQRATTWELGVRGQRTSLAWEITAYLAPWSNEILRLAAANGAALGAVNATPTRHEGLELSARWRLLGGAHQLTLNTNATWNHFFFTGDPVYGRNRLGGVPPFLGSAELLMEEPRGFFCALGADCTAGRTPIDHGGRMTFAGRTLGRVRAGWRAGEAWTVFVDVRNVLDRHYIASTSGVLDLVRNPAATSFFLPGAGRNATLGIEWRH